MKKKGLKNFIKNKVSGILMLFAIFLNTFSPFVSASISMSGVDVHCNNSKAPFLMYYTDYKTHAYFVTYTNPDDGKEYPAYCINRDLPGADPDHSYTVDVNELYSNNKVWRVLKNGYPYSSISSMGLKNKYEAFYVTKQAIYCVLGQTELSNYSAVDGYEYVYEAFVKLVNEGLHGTETYKPASVSIAKNGSGATSTINGKSYYVQSYKVSSTLEFTKFTVAISGLPSGTLILNSNNVSQKSYSGTTIFKIAIPESKIKKDTVGIIRIEDVQVKTYPVLYAKTRTAGTQDYAMVRDPYEPTEKETRLSLTIPDVTVVKKDRTTGKNIPNATYTIYKDVNENGKYDSGDTRVKTVKTGSDGTVTISGLTPGKYIAVETKAPDGYNLDSIDQPFTIAVGGSDVTVNSNDSIGVTIVKKDRDTGDNLAGAVYKIYKDVNENGYIDSNDTLVYTTPKTNSNGETTVCGLDKGKYIAMETKAPTGYNLDSKDQTFSITAGGKAITLKFTNSLAPTIVKTDRSTKKALAGAVYEIYQDVNKNGTIDKGDKLVFTTKATNKKGETKVCSLSIGQYISKEIQAPTGYNLDDKDNVFTISPTNKAVTIQSTNSLGPTIVKTDRETGKTLAGAIFKIYKDVNENGKYDEGIDTLVYTTPETNSKGKTSVCGLNTGKYIAVETQAPSGYNLDSKELAFSITTGGKAITLKANDSVTPTIIKTDRDSKKVLAGAVYEIYRDVNGNGYIDNKDTLVYTTKPTDKNGVTKICSLSIGSYISREIKAPTGYNLDDKDNKFTISTKNKAITIQSTNTLAPTIVKTDRDSKKVLAGAVYEIYQDLNKNGVIDKGDKLIFTTKPTNKLGTTKVCILSTGQYITKEIKAPKGYNLDDRTNLFRISTKGTAVTVQSTNTLAPTIVKTDRDTNKRLEGAVYEIYQDVNKNGVIDKGDKLIYTTKPTDKNGITKVCPLFIGEFIAKEIKAPEGYNLNSKDTVFSITTKNKAVTIRSTDTIAPTIVKTDRETGKTLAGAVYEIYKDVNESKTIDEGDELLFKTEPTSEDGSTKVCGLNVGQYISREIKAPEGYNLDDEDYVFTITTDDKAVIIQSTNAVGPTIVKVDRDTGDKLSGAVYEIYQDINADGIIDEQDKLVYTTEPTLEDGTTKVCGLPTGQFIAKEIKAPEGYNLNAKDQVFLITVKGNSVTLTTDDSIGTKIIKTDRETEKPLAGAVYEIYKDVNESKTIDEGDELVFTTEPTSEDGSTKVCGLNVGQYISREIKAPEGYNLDDEDYVFTITTDDKAVIINSTDTIAPTIIKTDRDTGKTLAGAVYEIYKDTNENKVIDEGDELVYTTEPTLEDGTTKVCGLNIGQYISREKISPEGYNLNSEDTVFNITTDDKAVIINSTDTIAPTIIKTDRDTGKTLAGAVYEIYKDVNESKTIDEGDELVFTTEPTSEDGSTKVCGLNVGQYISREIKAPEGYNLNSEDTVFNITTEDKAITINSTDTVSPAIIKTDRDTQKPVAGAVYEIYQDINKDGIIDEQDKLVYTTEPTSEDGTTKVCGLPTGQFIAKEIKAPQGYNLDSENVIFNITTEDKAITINSTDTVSPTIVKTDRDTQKPLAGAVYEIYKDTNENKILDEGDELVFTTEPTSEDGTTKVCGLPVGQFISREKIAPEGYNLDSENPVFNITTEDKAIIINSTDTVSPTIVKKERSTEYTKPNVAEEKEIEKDTYLPGAVYEIYKDVNKNKLIDENDELVYTTEPTNEKGETKVCGLPVGQFITKEIKAPEGYNLDDENHVFEILCNGTALTINSSDTAITSTLEINKVAKNDNEITGDKAGDGLEGAIYNIYDINHKLLYDNVKTDKNGIANVILRYGKYIVEEVRPPEYYLLNPNDKTNSQVISVYKQGELIPLKFEDEAVAVGLVIEKTGIVQCQPNDEILYKFPQLKNDSNVALNNFTWTDVLPTKYIRVTKLYTGTYSQDLNYTIWYKTNLSKDYIQYVNANSKDGTYNTLKNNYIDFAKLNTKEEYVTEWKLEFGTVEPKFTAKEKPFMFAKVNSNIKDNDMWTNNTYLTGDYTSIDGNTIPLASKDDWTTTSYKFSLKIKKLPKTGE